MAPVDELVVASRRLTLSSFSSKGYKPVIDFVTIDDDIRLLVCALPLLIVGVLALVFVCLLRYSLLQRGTGKAIDCQKLDSLAAKIKSGSFAFLKEESMYVTGYVIWWSVILFMLFTVNRSSTEDYTDGLRSMSCFIVGAFLNGLSGFIGMSVATDGNVRTTVACARSSLNEGLRTAFTAGAAVGFAVVGLAAVGFSACLLLMGINRNDKQAVQCLHSFGFGASSVAIFTRVAGGIYTKAADMGADLVGKIEAGIDEDDPHNPAVIADNVGDNVGDVAGMGADLFESYIGSLLAASTLGASMGSPFIALPLWLATAGLLTSFVGFFVVYYGKLEGAHQSRRSKWILMPAFEGGTMVANGLFIFLAALICILLFGPESEVGWKCFACVIIGLLTGMVIGTGSEYFTSLERMPTISITDRATAGPALVIMQGMSVGMISTILPASALCVAILACAELAHEYGVALAAVGMLATLAMSLSTDAFGPVADNAGGLAEMAGLGPEVREKTDILNALGKTTAAIGKGFAVGSAILTALSLLAAYKEEVTQKRMLDFKVNDPMVISGAIIGAMLPYLFSALTMFSVGKAAAEMIGEVRRQFQEVTNEFGVTLKDAIKRASQGEVLNEQTDVHPETDKCVQISAQSAVKEMIAPILYAVLTPLIVGFMLGPRAVMGLLVGCIGSAAMLAVVMSNAGGAWDNAKKLCEKHGMKTTQQGKACVIGDAVGDPFKDTSGPSLNILLKLMAMVALLMAPIFDGHEDWEQWYVGLFPLAIALFATFGLVFLGILSWADPLYGIQAPETPESEEECQVEDLRKVAKMEDPEDQVERLALYSGAKAAWS